MDSASCCIITSMYSACRTSIVTWGVCKCTRFNGSISLCVISMILNNVLPKLKNDIPVNPTVPTTPTSLSTMFDRPKKKKKVSRKVKRQIPSTTTAMSTTSVDTTSESSAAATININTTTIATPSHAALTLTPRSGTASFKTQKPIAFFYAAKTSNFAQCTQICVHLFIKTTNNAKSRCELYKSRDWGFSLARAS